MQLAGSPRMIPSSANRSMVRVPAGRFTTSAISPASGSRPASVRASRYRRTQAATSSSLADGPPSHASPKRPARRMAGSTQPPNQIGGRGRCTGRGLTVALVTRIVPASVSDLVLGPEPLDQGHGLVHGRELFGRVPGTHSEDQAALGDPRRTLRVRPAMAANPMSGVG